MNFRTERHCDDAALLSHLEGELSFLERHSVERHVTGCWTCRGRQDELRRQMLRVASLVEQDCFPGVAQVASARTRLMAQMWQTEPSFVPRAPRRRLAFLVGLTAATCTVAVLLIPRPPVPQAIAPARLIQEAVNAEAATLQTMASRGTVHQAFRIVTTEIRPLQARRESRLEIWVQPAAERFRSRWQDASGVLKHALWRPDRNRAYALSRDDGNVRRLARSGADDTPVINRLIDQDSLDAMERTLMQWLETRRWVPLDMADGFRQFAGRDGAALELDGAGAMGPRLRASGRIHGVLVSFELLLDGRTYRPRLQSIRFEDARRAFEVQLIPEDTVSATPVSFEPESLRVDVAGIPLEPVPSLSSALEPRPVLPSELAHDDLLHVQLEADHVLHRLRTCLGEPLELVRNGDTVTVRGVVGTQERKGQVTAALARLAAVAPLRVDVKSADEAFGEAGPSKQTQVGASHPPVSRKNYRWCRDIGPKDCAMTWDQLLEGAEQMLSDASALQRLALEYGAIAGDRLVDEMARDHFEALRTAESALRRKLQELYPDQAPAVGPTGSVEAVAWQQGAEPLRDRTRTLLHALRAASTGAAPDAARATLGELAALDVMLAAMNSSLERSKPYVK